ncbi:MAG: hypothetical protein ACPG19_11710 [Saprospiraceae bacterium]
MKSKLIPLFLIAFLIGSSNSLYAGKKNFFEGFVITSMGDTLKGQIQYVNPVYNELKVKFRSEEGKRTTFKPKDLVEYAFLFPEYDKGKKTKNTSWVHYYRKRVNVSPVERIKKIETLFLQRITKGDIALYNYYSLKTNKIHSRNYKQEYFVEQMTPDGFDLVHIGRANFKEISKELLVMNPRLSEKLGTYGYGYKYFVKVVKLHNRMMNGEKVGI